MTRPPKSVPVSKEDELVPYIKKDGPFYIMFKDEERPIRLAKTGPASLSPRTLSSLMEECAEKQADNVMFGIEWPEPPLDKTQTDPAKQVPPALPLSEWKTWTYKQGFADIKAAAMGYIKLGFQPLDTVSILGFNSPFWALAAFAAIYGGGINNGMYATDSEEQIIYKVQNSETSVAVVDTKANYEKFAKNLNEMPTLKAIVIWKDVDAIPDGKQTELERDDGSKVAVLSWEELLTVGSDVPAEVLQERVANQKPGMCSTLIFTSGTTGMPKAVMISHDNLYYQGMITQKLLPDYFMENTLILVSYLPLSHIAGYMLDVISTITIPVLTDHKTHAEVYFARSYDLKNGSIVFRLKEVRPTAFFGVPRVWEKFQEKILERAPKGAVAKRLGAFAKGKMLKKMKNLQLGGSGSSPMGISVSNKLLGKVHKNLGLDRVKFALSGAAPMKRETIEYWASLGIFICEVYGMSENCGATTCATMKYRQFGTVGPAIPSSELKVFKPEKNNEECPPAEGLSSFNDDNQGELCYRGRHIMLGYLANRNMGEQHVEDLKKKNEAAIDENGFLHSGDKGFKTKQGMVKVTGRYKELIIGAGGENIAPVPIEDDFKARCNVLSNVMMIGNERKYNVALVTLKVEGATGEVPGNNVLTGPAKTLGDQTGATTIEEACKSPEFVKFIEQKLEETNNNGAVVLNNTFKIQKFTILPSDFSVLTEELTATLKLKRSVVEEKYKDVIEKIYATEGVFIPYK